MGICIEARPELPQRIAQTIHEFSVHPYALLAQAESGRTIGIILAESHAIAECGHDVWVDFSYLQTSGVNHYHESMPDCIEAECRICGKTVSFEQRGHSALLRNVERRELDIERTIMVLRAIAQYWDYAKEQNIQEAVS